jgi:hypothetical protein
MVPLIAAERPLQGRAQPPGRPPRASGPLERDVGQRLATPSALAVVAEIGPVCKQAARLREIFVDRNNGERAACRVFQQWSTQRRAAVSRIAADALRRFPLQLFGISK